jgi:hypothetical protein
MWGYTDPGMTGAKDDDEDEGIMRIGGAGSAAPASVVVAWDQVGGRM